ncbi:3-mercaptopyruvate sulfurtransferase [Neobacillus rhizosphaerae]|uniref:3-mercaptopyruvate sulfurtransferase n=1 Tax=Neobacillus rhizosphaerae TaxID=2880965 RepID=A0ABM9ESE5_9BACI|nr:sulfurtransferase [Neobacillus rhizosphaerae]CAH2715573.1 3-mercaptopyruvate sulfurtransferase [Neobacillus rhizosphaerae]
MKYVKDKEWLLKNLNEKNVRIVDCRFSLAESQKGKIEYLHQHVPGAVFFDLEKDLSGTVGEHGGRHPLPNVVELVSKLENAGISDDTTIIAYDNGEGAFAARFWWLLHYLGHEHVYVLDGGFNGWLNENYPLTANIPSYEKADFHVNLKSELIATVEEVKEVVEKQQINKMLIDSREEKRYLGLEEPIDKKAGHIPGAINKPWMEGFKGSQYLSAEEQRQRFSDVDANQQIIVYCGSGVTATPNFLALKEAGFEKVKLYAGSFSDWISYKENKVE